MPLLQKPFMALCSIIILRIQAQTLSSPKFTNHLASQVYEALTTSLPKSTMISKRIDIYVNRPMLEERILAVYETCRFESDAYTVIIGPHGAGKSFLVAHVLANKLGVVDILVTDADTPASLVFKLLRNSGVTIDDNLSVGIEALGPVLENAASKQPNFRRITIVFEVNRASSSNEVLRMVQSTAKHLAGSANVIVVLSEGNAALAFGADRRLEIMWVDGMVDEEATAYAKLLCPQVSSDDLDIFFKKVNTHCSPLCSNNLSDN